MSKSSELKNKFVNWSMKIQFSFLENDLFQPIGLELSCANINFETLDDYSFKGIEKSNIDNLNYPLAYYRPDTDSIHIFIEHEAFKKRFEDSEKMAFLAFLLFHEANHRLLIHAKRGENKDHDLWNVAGDMEIHNMLYVYNEIMNADMKYHNSLIYRFMKNYVTSFLFTKDDEDKSEGLFEKEFLQNTAEEIYMILLKSKKENQNSFYLNMPSNGGGSNNNDSDIDDNDDNSKSNHNNIKVTVKETTYTTPSGKKITTTNIEFPKTLETNNNNNRSDEENKDKEAGELTRRTLMENNLIKKVQDAFDENGEGRGFLSKSCKEFLKKLFHVKIDWKKILRNSLQTALEKSEYFSWAKPRTSLFGMSNSPYLPDRIDDECAYGTVIIARDESGSMSNEECEQAAAIIMDAKEYYKKIIIIKHDTSITSYKEIEELDDKAKKYLLERDSYGGTSHEEVFKFIDKYSKNNREEERISCCIFITDMESDIEETQNIISDEIPRIYLAPTSYRIYSSKIKGKIIQIES